MKKAMTKTMTEALNIPFFTYQDEMEANLLLKLRKEMKKTYSDLTLLPFFLKAASLAMLEFPVMNVNVNPETDEYGYIKEYVLKKDHNFSIAMDTKDGLSVPNIKQVQKKSILQLNEEIIHLRNKAQTGGLTASDFENSTFSVSSVGNLGGTYFVPTILRPQGAIMAIGKSKKVAKYVEDKHHPDGYKFIPSENIFISISADHRVIEGAYAIKFA